MWIADEAAQASKEVPEGWEARADPRGNLYYTNVASGDSLREHPRDVGRVAPIICALVWLSPQTTAVRALGHTITVCCCTPVTLPLTAACRQHFHHAGTRATPSSGSWWGSSSSSGCTRRRRAAPRRWFTPFPLNHHVQLVAARGSERSEHSTARNGA